MNFHRYNLASSFSLVTLSTYECSSLELLVLCVRSPDDDKEAREGDIASYNATMEDGLLKLSSHPDSNFVGAQRFCLIESCR